LTAFILGWFCQALMVSSGSWDCQILPAEQKIEVDPQSGARIIFATTDPAKDWNFYFHERCFLGDNRILVFYSDRFGRTEILAFLLQTGELVRLTPPDVDSAGSALASRLGDRIFVVRKDAIYEWKLTVSLQPKTSATITERKLTDFPEGTQQCSSLTENSDGRQLSFGCRTDSTFHLGVYDFKTGTTRLVSNVGFKFDHLQFHHHRPNILSISRSYPAGTDWAPLDPAAPPHARIWFVNIDTGIPVPAFYQVPGELVTHECWWVNDQMTFLGGHHRVGNREEGSVKVYDFKTGDIRIIGAGAWLEDATAQQLSQVNWWHACGSPDGKWVVADNWHGIVALFNAKTTEKKILTTGHRTYGGGLHLHAGWDLAGKMVEFTSSKLGNPDVCIGVLPEHW